MDSTHTTVIQYNDEATWYYDSTTEEYYYGFGCVIVSAGPKIPIVSEFTQRKQIDGETATCITKDAIGVDTAIWMLGDSAYDILKWHDFLLAQEVVPIAPYNPRNTDDPLDIEYGVEDHIDEYTEDISLKQSVLAETYDHRTLVERTNEACKDCRLGNVHARGRASTQEHRRSLLFASSQSQTTNEDTTLDGRILRPCD